MSGFDQAREWVGQQLLDASGNEVGEIGAVYLDAATFEPLWAQILDDDEDARSFFVPLEGVAKVDDGVTVEVAGAEIRGAPVFSATEFLTSRLQSELSNHFTAAPETRPAHELLVVGSGPASAGDPANPPPPPPPPPQSDGGQHVGRYLQGRCPQRVRLKEVIPLEVRVGIETAADSVELLPFDVPAEGADIRLVLHCPGFEPRSPLRRTVHVPPDGPSQWTLFEMEAVTEGVHEIMVSAFRDGTGLGELAMQLTVEAHVKTGPPQSHERDLQSLESSPGELSLIITFDPQQGTYRFMLFHADEPDEEQISKPLLVTPKSAVEGLVNQLNALARDSSGLSNKATRQWLRNKGVELWNDFIPEQLQQEFWRRQDRITSLTVISSLDPVPWELLYPLAPGKDCGFLAEQFPVLRWIPKVPKTRALALSDPAFVLPDRSPPRAEAEVRSVAALLQASADGAIRDLDRLIDTLTAAGFGALHFACHNTFRANQPDTSEVVMSGGPFEPTYLSGLGNTRALRARSPLVFMNACRSAGQAALYTQLTGWASGFVKAGAGAFVGSLWEVRDQTAPIFAETFYNGLVNEHLTLGEALQSARLSIRDQPGDPTWLAYTVYGHSAARAA